MSVSQICTAAQVPQRTVEQLVELRKGRFRERYRQTHCAKKDLTTIPNLRPIQRAYILVDTLALRRTGFQAQVDSTSVMVIVPKLDEMTEEVTVVDWLRKDGERVEKKEAIVVIETVKASLELDAPASGIIRILHHEGDVVPVGEPIAEISPLEEARTAAVVEPSKAAIEEASVTVGVRASPLAKKLAKKYGVDLSRVVGTGPDGLITERDMTAYGERAREPPGTPITMIEEVIPLVGWRKEMAERVAYSKRTAAHITTIAEVDATELVNTKEKIRPVLEEKHDVKITYTAFIVKAVAKAILDYPIINSMIDGDKIIVKKYCNIGVATSLQKGGLVIPVIHDAEKLSIVEIARKLEELDKRVQAGRLQPDDLKNGTFTISNVGMFGVIMNTPIIVPSQSAILGVGALRKRPIVVNDQILAGHIMYLSLSYDHRIIEGLPAILFLQEVRRLLEDPSELLK